MDKLKTALEKAWDSGFFYNIRYGIFNETQYSELRNMFDESKISIGASDGNIDAQMVSLIWFIPLFIEWQRERLTQNGLSKDKIDEVINYFYNECEKILGLP